MKWNMLVGSLVLGAGLCNQSFGIDLLSRMLGGKGSGCDTSCCDTAVAGPSCGSEGICGGGLLGNGPSCGSEGGLGGLCGNGPSCGTDGAALLALAAERVLASVVLPAGSTPDVQQLLVLPAERKLVLAAPLASVLCWT